MIHQSVKGLSLDNKLTAGLIYQAKNILVLTLQLSPRTPGNLLTADSSKLHLGLQESVAGNFLQSFFRFNKQVKLSNKEKKIC